MNSYCFVRYFKTLHVDFLRPAGAIKDSRSEAH